MLEKINHRENMRAALECRQPETAVPIWELEFQIWDDVSGQHVILGKEFSELSPKEQENTMYQNAEIMMSVARDMNFSAITLPGSYWEVAPGQPSYYWLPEEAKLKQNRILIRYCKEIGIMAVGVFNSVISMPNHGNNYVEYCYKLFDAPEEIDEIAEIRYRTGLEKAKMCSDLGYDVIVTASDIADNKGPFYSPEQLERWVYPYLSDWAQEIKKLGMYTVMHTDGNLYPILDRIADSGINGLQAIDPVAGMDMKKAKEIVAGRLCLCGNVETGLLVTGPKEFIYENTRDVLVNCKAGGGMVLGTSNATMPETPAEHYREMIRAWKDFGWYT